MVSLARNVTLHGSSLKPGSAGTVWLEALNTPPMAVLDFTGNWWGTTDSLAIAESIWDLHDDPDGNAFGVVDFMPIADGSLPTSATTMGGLKSYFRNRE